VDELVRQFKREVQNLHKKEGRGRGAGGGRHRNLARMFEALRLYSQLRSAPVAMSYIEWAKTLGHFVHRQRGSTTRKTASYGRRGQGITALAEKMICTAVLPTHDSPWTRTFL
jgi:hypothetical protein